jgi:hypothetical protein
VKTGRPDRVNIGEIVAGGIIGVIIFMVMMLAERYW